MTSEGINRELRRKPFLPFRLVMADGKTYEIRHPDHLWAGFVEANVARDSMADSGIWDRDDILDIAHIIRIEPLPAPLTPSTASANGAH